MPTRIASDAARISWASARDGSPEIHRESPERVAIRPSSVIAHFAVTHGRPTVRCLTYASFSVRASRSATPTRVAIPASRQPAQAPAAHLPVGIEHRRDDPPDARPR